MIEDMSLHATRSIYASILRASQAVAGALIILCSDASAEGTKSVYLKPVYDPATKSYFELLKVAEAAGLKTHELNWAEAQAYAARLSFKGATGRLAIVKHAETHALILKELRPSEYTWIGLRYFCDKRKLEW